jgi:hypothetical protein
MIEQTPNHTQTTDDGTVASDVLDGAAEIGAFTGKSEHVVYKKWKTMEGVWRDGGRLRASKRALLRNHNNRARTGK